MVIRRTQLVACLQQTLFYKLPAFFVALVVACVVIPRYKIKRLVERRRIYNKNSSLAGFYAIVQAFYINYCKATCAEFVLL